MVTHQDVLTSLQWEYIILDEGHKIRNPDAKVGAWKLKFLGVFLVAFKTTPPTTRMRKGDHIGNVLLRTPNLERKKICNLDT